MTAGPVGAGTGAYVTRPGMRDDLPGILSLLRLTLSDTGVTAKTPAFWNWKHERSPSGPSVVSLACDPATGEIVGLRAMMRWQLRDQAGSVWEAVRPVDTTTHPGWQKKGIFRRLTLDTMERLADGPTRIVFNTPNATSMPAYLKLGWSIVCQQVIRLRPARPDRLIVDLLLRRWPMQPRKWRRNGTQIAIVPVDALTADESSELFAFCEEAEGRRETRGFRTNRSAAFVGWRYSHPSASYHVLTTRCEQDGELSGALFFRNERRCGIRGVFLCDMFAGKGMKCGELLDNALSKIRAGYFLASASTGTGDESCLRSRFFVPVRTMSIAARPVDPVASEDLSAQLECWDLSLSDLEIF